jgi:hypothetical protein
MKKIKKTIKKTKSISGIISDFLGFSNNTHNTHPLKTPRSNYYDTNFTQDVTLLDNNEFFQVSFTNVGQFYNYVNILPKKLKKDYPDCVIQSLFALGLRNIKALYNDVDNIVRKNPSEGVTISDLYRYLEKSFGLNKYTISWEEIYDDDIKNILKLKTYDERVRAMSPVYKDVNAIYSTYIHPNHATILILNMYRYYMTWAHCIVLFKHGNQIMFFDPQQNIISTSLETMYKSDNILITSVYITSVKGVTKPIKLLNSSAYIHIFG